MRNKLIVSLVAASVFLLSSVKSPDKARNTIIRELQHEETNQRINAILRSVDGLVARFTATGNSCILLERRWNMKRLMLSVMPQRGYRRPNCYVETSDPNETITEDSPVNALDAGQTGMGIGRGSTDFRWKRKMSAPKHKTVRSNQNVMVLHQVKNWQNWKMQGCFMQFLRLFLLKSFSFPPPDPH